jgi:hypothetical protein
MAIGRMLMIKLLDIGYWLYKEGIKQGVVKIDEWTTLGMKQKRAWINTALRSGNYRKFF